MENKKFYFDGSFKFATLNDIDAIVTEDYPGKDIANILDKVNVELI
jgi:DeoR/GlpR family transcriptional regulator of sugar metabolism